MKNTCVFSDLVSRFLLDRCSRVSSVTSSGEASKISSFISSRYMALVAAYDVPLVNRLPSARDKLSPNINRPALVNQRLA